MSDTGRIKLAQSSFKEDAPHSQGFSILLSGASIILIGAVLGRVLDFITRTMIGRHFGPGNFGLLNGRGIFQAVEYWAFQPESFAL